MDNVARERTYVKEARITIKTLTKQALEKWLQKL